MRRRKYSRYADMVQQLLERDGYGDDSAEEAPSPDPRSEKFVPTVVIS